MSTAALNEILTQRNQALQAGILSLHKRIEKKDMEIRSLKRSRDNHRKNQEYLINKQKRTESVITAQNDELREIIEALLCPELAANMDAIRTRERYALKHMTSKAA